jgi:hypothetical protein
VNITYEKNLPYKYVFYPYHAFIGFKESLESDDIYFCSCFKDALINYIAMRKLQYYKDPDHKIINKIYFPIDFVKNYEKEHNDTESDILGAFKFKDNICHECLKLNPRGYYYSTIYSAFYGHFGWYIDKRHLMLGIDMLQNIILDDKCPEYIRTLRPDHFKDHYDYYEKQKKLLRDEIENSVREIFGYKKIGEEWVSETIVYYEIKQTFPDIDVIHHGKPEWIGLQHLDIWIPAWKVAIEYNGEQHYTPIPHFGGEEGYKKIVERDKRKYELCKQNGVRLFSLESILLVDELIDNLKENYYNK